MSKKKDGSGGNAFISLAGIAVPFMLRKVLATVWSKVVGKEPPIDLTDPKVTFPEAIGWAIVLAIIVESARFGITRPAAAKRRELPEAAAESD
jgi:hypothetical protein